MDFKTRALAIVLAFLVVANIVVACGGGTPATQVSTNAGDNTSVPAKSPVTPSQAAGNVQPTNTQDQPTAVAELPTATTVTDAPTQAIAEAPTAAPVVSLNNPKRTNYL